MERGVAVTAIVTVEDIRVRKGKGTHRVVRDKEAALVGANGVSEAAA